MIKKLTVIGHSLGVILDRPVLDLLNINRETELTVSTDGDALILRPVRPHASTSQPIRKRPSPSRLLRNSQTAESEQLTKTQPIVSNEAEREETV